jgi:predicted N-acetyltransferase YhbS
MEIQTASLRDLASLRRLESIGFEKDAWAVLDLVAVLTWSEVVRLKAVIEGEMIGFIAGDPRPAQNMGWIATIVVDPRYQGQGIGTALLRACEERLKSRASG